MLKRYYERRPEYLIWQYDGEEIIPEKVVSMLRERNYTFRVYTMQRHSDGIVTTVDRHIEILKEGAVAETVVGEGYYIIFTEYTPGGRFDDRVRVSKTLREFEEVPLSNGQDATSTR